MNRVMRLLVVLTMVVMGWSALAVTANADAPVGFDRGAQGSVEAAVPDLLAPVTITQNTDVETLESIVACGGPAPRTYTTQNSYYRRFDLDGAHGITDTLTLQNFTFGVFSADNAFAIEIAAYSIPSTATLTLANLTEISTAIANVDDTASGTLITVPVTGTISGTLDLVMEINVPDGEPNLSQLYIASNEGGQAGPTYLSAPDCGATQPTNLADIGFPDIAVIMIVGGDTASSPTAVSLGDLTATATDQLPVVSFVAAGAALLLAGLVVLRRK